MRGRYRNVPGNGFRPNATGPGNAGATSRISNEGSFKGLRMNNYEHRNHSRGNYGRGRGGGGNVKHFQPPARETDVFVEAGKLAAEYLVSKGVLPPNALSGKIPFDDLRNLLNNSGFKPREASSSQIHGDVRGSSRSRLGNSGLNQGREMRDNSEENNYDAARSFVRGGKSLGSLERNDSEANKLEGRLSLAEKDTASLTVDADNATVANDECEHQENEHANSGIEKLSPREPEPKVNESDKRYELEKSDAVEGQDAGSSSNSVNNKGGLSITSVDAADKLRDDGMSVEARNNNEMCQKDGKAVKDTGDGGEGYVDLAKECKFINLPTKTRSSRKFNNSKREQQSSNGGAQNVSKGKVSKVPEVIDLDSGTSSGTAPPLQINDQKILQPDALKDPKLELGEGVTLIARPGHHLRSNSFPERSLLKDKKPGEELSRFASFNAGISEKDGKRALGDETDQKEGFKRLKESDGHPRSYSSIDSQPTSDEPKASSNAQGSLSTNQGCFDVSLYPRDQADSSGFMQEKLLFPGSFKNLDLNLTGTSDHGANSRTIVPSLTLTQKEPKPVDMEFSTSNNSNLLNKTGVARNNIEIIDLENDFAEEDKTFGNPDKRGDPIFTDLDGFPSNVHNANEMPDVAQDGYGLMISELLRNEGPSCSSVPQDLNSLHSLSNPEGILGDDESIYMSLDEIPLSLLGPWEQSGHDYGKPF